MFLLDRMIGGGIRFVLDKVIVSAETELNDDSHLRDELMAAQMRVELGEMSQEAFAALEDEILLRIREIRERRGEGSRVIAFDDVDENGVTGISAGSLSGIEASFTADDIHSDLYATEAALSELTIDAAPVAVKEAVGPAARKKTAKKKKTTRKAQPTKAAKKTAKTAKADRKPKPSKTKKAPGARKAAGTTSRRRT